MKTSIKKKIVLIYLCTIVIIMLISGTYIVYGIEQRAYESLITEVESMAETIENTGNYTLHGVMGEAEVSILNDRGIVETSTNEDIIGKKQESAIIIEAIYTKHKASSYIKYFSSIKEKGSGFIEHARPVKDSAGKLIHIIYIKSSTLSIYLDMLSVIRTIGLGLVLAMVITAICAIIFSQFITAPIKMLTRNSKKLAKGDTIAKIPVEAADEIGELTQSFNYMASQLSATMEVVTSEKNKLEKIFENMADGVVAFNQQGIVIHVNSACYDIVGRDKMGSNFEVIAEKMGILDEFEILLSGQKNQAGDGEIRLEDKYLKIQFAPYLNARGEAEGLVMVIQDITKQRRLDDMRKEFVANVSHELRTPLTTVKIYTETLLDGAIEDKEHAIQFLGVMEKEADRMTALVQDLLELSRIDNSQIQLNFVALDLKEVLKEVLDAQHVHIIKKEHTLEVSYDENKTYPILGDAFRVRQILHNIFSNAVKYTDEGGKIRVTMKVVGETIEIKIEDNGMGIPKEDIDRIFERFYRVDKARSRKLGGTGLGLSIAKELMTLHKGRITIESKVGTGTSVSLVFPIYKSE